MSDCFDVHAAAEAGGDRVIVFVVNERTGARWSKDVGNFEQIYLTGDQNGIWIGSSPECNVVLEDDAVAGRHARHFAKGHHKLVEIHGASEAPWEYRVGMENGLFRVGPFRVRVVQSRVLSKIDPWSTRLWKPWWQFW
jgi:hypothetical protein